MMDKWITYSLDTLIMFAEWVQINDVALSFAALIVFIFIVAKFKQLSH